MPDDLLGPGALARLTGVSTDTLRHYEKRGLLPPAQRTAAGYRRYPGESVRRIALIQGALAVGFSLDELARVLGERDRGGAPCRSVRALLDVKLEALDAQIAALTSLRAELCGLRTEWEALLARTPPGAPAHLLERLSGRPGIAAARSHRRRHARPIE